MEQAGQPAAEGTRASAGTAESTAAAAVGPGPVHQQTPAGPAGASPPDGEQPPLPWRQADPARPSRALVVHPRTLEVLRPLGVTDELLARGDPAPAVRLHLGRREVEARLGAFPLEDTAFPFPLFVSQSAVEEVLAAALARQGVEVERGVEPTDVVDCAGTAVSRIRRGSVAEFVDYRYLAGATARPVGSGPSSASAGGAPPTGRRWSSPTWSWPVTWRPASRTPPPPAAGWCSPSPSWPPTRSSAAPVRRRVLALTHLLFWAGAGQDPVASSVRGSLVPLAAPPVPFLLRRRRVLGAGVRVLSRLGLRYRHSPLSVDGVRPPRGGSLPGDRLPDAAVTVDGRRRELHELLARPGVHLLLERDAPPAGGVAVPPGVAVHRLTDRPGRGALLVRPDGYVGLRSGTADPVEIGAWLARIALTGASRAPWVGPSPPARLITPGSGDRRTAPGAAHPPSNRTVRTDSPLFGPRVLTEPTPMTGRLRL